MKKLFVLSVAFIGAIATPALADQTTCIAASDKLTRCETIDANGALVKEFDRATTAADSHGVTINGETPDKWNAEMDAAGYVPVESGPIYVLLGNGGKGAKVSGAKVGKMSSPRGFAVRRGRR